MNLPAANKEYENNEKVGHCHKVSSNRCIIGCDFTMETTLDSVKKDKEV
jgi:hypothetical protein